MSTERTPPTAEPSLIDLVHELHTAVHGASWARPEPPAIVWAMLLDRVRDLAQGKCAECLRKTDAAPPEGSAASNPVPRWQGDSSRPSLMDVATSALPDGSWVNTAHTRVWDRGTIASLVVATLRAAGLLPRDTPQPGGEELIDVAWQAIRGNAECQRFVGDCFTVPNPQCVCRADAEAAVKAVEGYVLAASRKPCAPPDTPRADAEATVERLQRDGVFAGLGGEASIVALIDALQFYANEFNWTATVATEHPVIPTIIAYADRGERARAALAASQPKDA